MVRTAAWPPATTKTRQRLRARYPKNRFNLKALYRSQRMHASMKVPDLVSECKEEQMVKINMQLKYFHRKNREIIHILPLAKPGMADWK